MGNSLTGDGSPDRKGPKPGLKHSGLRGNVCFGIQELSKDSTHATTRSGSHTEGKSVRHGHGPYLAGTSVVLFQEP